MKKGILSFIFTLSLIIVLILTTVQIITFDINYFESKFNEYNIYEKTGIKRDNLLNITEKMLDYLKGEKDNLIIKETIKGEKQIVFGKRERLHMDDVKKLFINGFFIRNISFFVLIISFFLLYKYYKKYLVKLFMYAPIISIIFLMMFGILITSNFNRYFTLFHEILFTNDLWLLDPRTDILIQMLPLNFFYSISLKIIIYFLVELFIIFLIGYSLNKRYKQV